MAIKAKFFRTYIVRVRTPKGVFWYGGKHESYLENPNKDKYPGSGKILWNIYKKYGFNYKIKWSKTFGSREKSFEMERILIKDLREKHGKACINILPGGKGGIGHKWTEEQCLIHKLRLNRKETKERMKHAQKIAQNRPERKARQSEIMKEFYENGGSDKVSKATSKAQRIALHWQMPLKKEIYDLWLNLGKPKQGEVVKALSCKYPCTGSSIKLLIYEFRDKGFIEPL